MSVHCSLEALSSYVDAELSLPDREAVESHLEDCQECKSRVSHLRRVVGQLQRLEQVSPPSALGFEVERRLQFERRRRPFSNLLEDGIGRLTRQPLFAPLFALVIAFGVMFYVFSLGLARQETSGTQIVVGSAPTVEAEPEPKAAPPAPTEARLSEPEAGAVARRPVAEDVVSEARPSGPVAAASSKRADTTSLEPGQAIEVANRRFILNGGVWREQGLEDLRPEVRIDLAAGDALPEGLEALGERAGTYWLLERGPEGRTRVLEVFVPDLR